MGWFSPDVLGGDTPMDVLSSIGSALGELEPLYPLDLRPRRRAVVCRKLEAAGESLIDLLESEDFVCTMSDTDTSLPVLAACYLATGAAMPERLRALAVDAARRDPLSAPDTQWQAGMGTRQGWPERRAYMAALAEAIGQHQPGDVFLSFSHTGLLEQMARRAVASQDEPCEPAVLPGPAR